MNAQNQDSNSPASPHSSHHAYEYPKNNHHHFGHHFIPSKLVILFLIIFFVFAGGTGIYLANMKSKPKPIAPASTPLPTEASAKVGAPIDETAEWKTYENKTHGIMFKYPNNWIAQTSYPADSWGELNSKDYYYTVAELGPLPYTGPLMSLSYINNQKINSREKQVKIGVQQIPAYYKIEHDCASPPCQRYVFQHENKIYTLSTYGERSPDQNQTFDQILSTFKFTDLSATPKACTEEAKLCPDGSYVGRSGPNCEFTPCPGS